jgi:hypothetical protein
MSSYSNYLGSKKCCDTNLAKTVTGPQGPKGNQGAIGPYGQQGSTGSQGLRGATGPCCRGPQGPQGNDGAAGGAQGDTGTQGATGAQGSTGTQGNTGAQGLVGATGAQGLVGATGAQGSTGTQGATGAQGSTGTQGNTGAQGLVGATGSQGSTGTQGATGNSLWIDMNDTGYTGIGVTGIDVLIYGNLLVTGAIDPTSLTLTEIGKPSSTYGLTGTGAYINTSSGSLLLEPTSKQVIVNDTILLDDGTTNTNTIDNTSTTISALGSFGTMTNATDKIGIEIKEDDGMGKYGKVELQRDNLYFTYTDPTAPSIPNFNIGLFANSGGGLCGIQHQDNSFTDKSNLTLSTNENLVFTADNIDMNATRLAFPSIASQIVASQNYLDYNTSGTNTSGRLFLNQGTTGGGANPILFINQNNTNDGAGVIRMFKNRSANGSSIGELSFQAKTAEVGNPTKEYARIGTSIRNNATGNVDGSINLSARLNDTLTEFLRINGADGEVDIFRNLDMESNNILTDAKIGTRLAFPTGSYVDFANGTPDDYFRQDVDGIVYQFNNLTNVGTTTLLNKYATSEQYLKQELITPTNTLTTIIENDLTHHRIKLEETLSGSNVEITKDEIDIDDGTGSVAKLTPTDIQFDIGSGFVSIRPKYFSSSGGSVAVAFSPPVQSIYNLGAITGMATGQKWKIEIGFTSDLYASDGIVSYRVLDAMNNDFAVNSACSASVGGSSTAVYPKPTEVVIPSANTGSFISINDSFLLSGGTPPFTIDFTGGTYSGNTWNIGSWKATITLTYIEG